MKKNKTYKALKIIISGAFIIGMLACSEANAKRTLTRMETAYAEKKYELVKTSYKLMQNAYSDTPEFEEAKKIYDQVIEEEEAAAAALAEAKAAEEAAKAEAQREAEEKKKILLSKLEKDYDDVSGWTWYRNSYFTHYVNKNLVSLYFGTKETTRSRLNLTASYYGSDWIFFEKVFLSYDGNTIEISFDRYKDKETENSGGDVWEWINVSLDDQAVEFLKGLIGGNEPKIRFAGKYQNTRNLTRQEINGIKDVLNAYLAMRI
jgi:hypothetical protein